MSKRSEEGLNIAIIFAGGSGQRMNTRTVPKQFLELHGKPIIIYTLEQFECHEMIDGIIVVCVAGWIEYCKRMVYKFNITKVVDVIQGGDTGMLSRYYGVVRAHEIYTDDTICLMHDGVRPLIDGMTIRKNIESVEKYGSAVTVIPAIETVAIVDENKKIDKIMDRSECQIARAPQSFRLGDLLRAHQRMLDLGVTDCIDTAYLMQMSGHKVYVVQGTPENIKITTPTDFFIFRALVDARENSLVFGVSE